ncbi:MAG: IS200/IS605 family accessory protein TnpB-related protein [Desulfurococcaceae archaeon]|nr:IS200/IS605 family accessory protein TnpB-related protein [Desulfurococcaceae archaeon]
MEEQSKTLTKTVILDCYADKYARRGLKEIESAYKEMLVEMVEYAVKYKASQETLHSVFYEKFREKYPWLPTRVIKGAYRDAVRRAKSFRERRRKGKVYKDKPEVRRVTITYSDSQDWALEGGVIKLRTHGGWVELNYRNHKQLHRYLYSGWRLASELRLKILGKKIIAYLSFTRELEASYNPRNTVAVDVNENNVTVALFKDGALADVYRVETRLGEIVIAYSERRKRITRGNSTKIRGVRKKLKKLREKERKLDILRKTAKFIENLAVENRAVVVVGNINEKAKERMEEDANSKLRHRIHQWSVRKLVELLDGKPVHVIKVSERGTSSKDPFTGKRINKRFEPLVIRTAVKGLKKVKVLKIVLRITKVSGRILERDVVGAVNIGLKYLNSNGSPMALGSTCTHEVWVKLMNPHRGTTPLTEIQIFTNTIKHR